MIACVRIENMKMPECCGSCRLMRDRYCILLEDGHSYVADFRRRRSDCPLSECCVLDDADIRELDKDTAYIPGIGEVMYTTMEETND